MKGLARKQIIGGVFLNDFIRSILGLSIGMETQDGFHVGEMVFARWVHDGYWYLAEIKQIKDNSFYIRYLVDGKKERVSLSQLAKNELMTGDRIDGNWKGQGRYYPGVISSINGDRLNVQYDDGDTEETTAVQVRLSSAKAVNIADVSESIGEWAVGEFVFSNWTSDDYWYPGVILEIVEGDFLIEYQDDGSKEWVDITRIKKDDLVAGDTIYGNWKGSGGYYSGKIAERNKQELLIHYDDGDVEQTTLPYIRVTSD